MKEMTIPVLLIILSLIFMAFGVWSGEVPVLFQKAVSICLSCIGIG